MLPPVASPFLVPFDGSFRLAEAPTVPPEGRASKAELKARLKAEQEVLRDLQRMLWASDRWALLLVFQGMDASGKDSTVRAVMSGVNPAGCQVYGFKRPSREELDHDFLWRTARALPERGRIGIFNRSYYEEVLVVRVHPELLRHRRLPSVGPEVWEQRFASIRDHEAHLARNGTVVLKFLLHISRDEQRRRFLRRLDDPGKHWKFEAADVAERAHWATYQAAYEEALNATSRPWAPWYCVPADHKPSLRLSVARIVVERLRSMKLAYPAVTPAKRAELERARAQLEAETS